MAAYFNFRGANMSKTIEGMTKEEKIREIIAIFNELGYVSTSNNEHNLEVHQCPTLPSDAK